MYAYDLELAAGFGRGCWFGDPFEEKSVSAGDEEKARINLGEERLPCSL